MHWYSLMGVDAILQLSPKRPIGPQRDPKKDILMLSAVAGGEDN